MKSKFYQGIQFKFFSILVFSMILGVVSIIIFQMILKMLYNINANDLSRLEERYALIYFLVFISLTLGYYSLLSKKIIKRIHVIYKDVAKMSTGNLTAQIKDRNLDEIGHLARHINEMAKSLKEAKEREVKAEYEKTEIISNISHDLKTPLTSLLGYIELTKKYLNQDIEVCHEYLEVSERKCLDLKKQINDLLEYCSIHFGGLKLKMETISVTKLIKEVMTDFIPELERAEMNFLIDSDKQLLCVNGDLMLFVRMLQNIISNSIFYGKKGKKVFVKVWGEDREVKIKITNYGQKISKEDMPYLFDRFYRGEKSRSENTGGKGMGLTIAKSIADLHGGSIGAESSEDETSFIITVPKAENARQ